MGECRAPLAGRKSVCQAYLVTGCHVCTSSSFVPLLSAGSGELQVRRCQACRFVYLSRWEQSLAEAERLYDYYDDLTEQDLAQRHSKENRARQAQLLKQLAQLSPGRTLLDVGCGDGQLLQTATEEGWNALGIDLSPSAVRLCRERGLRASQTNFFDASLDEQRFDVIVMSELLEHVPAPQQFLKRARELLHEGGILYLTTPNFGSLSRRLLGEGWSVIHPEHIGYFERSSLRSMATDQAGLRVIRIDANNIAPSTLLAWWRGRREQSPTSPSVAHKEMRQSVDQKLRRAIARMPLLSASKDAANRLVSRSGLGDTLVAWLQKPANTERDQTLGNE